MAGGVIGSLYGNVGGGLRRAGGGVYAATNALQANDVASNTFDDFFEYSLAQPVTIHKNESAMAPVLQQDLPAEHVTLWSASEPTPLRAVWLENNSKLTLDFSSAMAANAPATSGSKCFRPSSMMIAMATSI